MKTKLNILSNIDRAFEACEIPLTEAELTFGGIESSYVIEHFFGKTRDDIFTTFETLYMEDFSYMTPKAVQHYLPCVLNLITQVEDIKDYDFDLWIYLRSFLNLEIENLRSFLDIEQKAAISEWALYLHKEWADTFLSDESEEALDLSKLYKNS